MTAASEAPRRAGDRRDRIIDACLEVVARDGVAGTSHRRVAAEAGVPLGSMTYYFTGMDQLLAEAFTRFADRSAADTERRLQDAADADDLEPILAEVIDHGAAGDPRDLAITYELYTLAARRPEFRRITHHWLERNRRVLERFVDPATARILDALVEGLTLHRALDDDARSRRLGHDAVRRIVAGAASRPERHEP